MIKRLKKYIRKYLLPPHDMNPQKAYDLWSTHYDGQSNNLIIALDDVLFDRLTGAVPLAGKTILDIGCGTGRHWEALSAASPHQLVGYDISEGMLRQLQQKFPGAETHVIKRDRLHATADNSCDLVISNLTIGYIANLEAAFTEWNRVLKQGGDVVITDFHPNALATGGKRNFSHNKKSISIKNYIHTIEQVTELAQEQQWQKYNMIEMPIDDSVKHFFEQQHSVEVFERSKGTFIVYGIHFKKTGAAGQR